MCLCAFFVFFVARSCHLFTGNKRNLSSLHSATVTHSINLLCCFVIMLQMPIASVTHKFTVLFSCCSLS